MARPATATTDRAAPRRRRRRRAAAALACCGLAAASASPAGDPRDGGGPLRDRAGPDGDVAGRPRRRGQSAQSSSSDPDSPAAPPPCSCAPLSYTVRLNLDGDCGSSTLTPDAKGVANVDCQMYPVGRDGEDLGGEGEEEQTRRTQGGEDWLALLAAASASSSSSTSGGTTEVESWGAFVRQPSDGGPGSGSVSSVQFIEFDSSGLLTIINEDSSLISAELEDGATVTYASDPGGDDGEAAVPGGAGLFVFGTDGGGTRTRGRYVWEYEDCVPPELDGLTLGWIEFVSTEPAPPELCPPLAAAPAPAASVPDPTSEPTGGGTSDAGGIVATASPTAGAATEAPMTEAPATKAPVTEAPTPEPTARATTSAPVTDAPVTEEPTPSPTAGATTLAPATDEPTMKPTEEATTLAPASEGPTLRPTGAVVSGVPTPSPAAAEPAGAEDVLCSCSPLVYEFTVDASGDCTTNGLDGEDGIDASACYVSLSGTTQRGGEDTDIQRKKVGDSLAGEVDFDGDDGSWSSFVSLSSLLSGAPGGGTDGPGGEKRAFQRLDLEGASVEVYDVQFLEFDASPRMLVITQEDADGLSLGDGESISFVSASGGLVPGTSASDQPTGVPGGVQLTVLGRVLDGETGEEVGRVRNTVTWRYTNGCEGVPFGDGGVGVGLVTVSAAEPASPEFCPALTSSPTPPPVPDPTSGPTGGGTSDAGGIVATASPTAGTPTTPAPATAEEEWTDFLGQVHDFTGGTPAAPHALFAKSSKAKSEKDAKAHKLFGGKGSKKSQSKSAKSKGAKMFKEAYHSMKTYPAKSQKVGDAKAKSEKAFRIFRGTR